MTNKLPPLAKSPRTTAEERAEAPPARWIFPAVMIVILTVGGWFIIQNLAATGAMEDCTMSGRHNCVPPIDTSKLER